MPDLLSVLWQAVPSSLSDVRSSESDDGGEGRGGGEASTGRKISRSQLSSSTSKPVNKIEVRPSIAKNLPPPDVVAEKLLQEVTHYKHTYT